jgi:hypothetical protein
LAARKPPGSAGYAFRPRQGAKLHARRADFTNGDMSA